MKNNDGRSLVDNEKKIRFKDQKSQIVSRIFIIVCAFSFLVSGRVFASELVIYGSSGSPPKYYMEQGEQKGFIVDITKWVMDEIQQEYKIELLPWPRAYKYSVEGKGVIIGLSKNTERLKIFDYSEPIYFADKMVVVKKGKEFPFQTIQDLKGKLVAVGIASTWGDVYIKAVKDKVFKEYEVSSIINALKMLVEDRVDAVLIGPGKWGLKAKVDLDESLEMDQFSVLPVPLVRDAKYLGIPKSLAMHEFLEKFNRALKKGWESGELEKIVSKYY